MLINFNLFYLYDRQKIDELFGQNHAKLIELNNEIKYDINIFLYDCFFLQFKDIRF